MALGGGTPAFRNQEAWPIQQLSAQPNMQTGWKTGPQDNSRAAPRYGAGLHYPNIS